MNCNSRFFQIVVYFSVTRIARGKIHFQIEEDERIVRRENHLYELQLLLKSPVAELCVIIIGKEYIRKRRDTIFRKADFKPIVKTNPPPPPGCTTASFRKNPQVLNANPSYREKGKFHLQQIATRIPVVQQQ